MICQTILCKSAINLLYHSVMITQLIFCLLTNNQRRASFRRCMQRIKTNAMQNETKQTVMLYAAKFWHDNYREVGLFRLLLDKRGVEQHNVVLDQHNAVLQLWLACNWWTHSFSNAWYTSCSQNTAFIKWHAALEETTQFLPTMHWYFCWVGKY